VTLEGGGQKRGKSGVAEETKDRKKLDSFRHHASEVPLLAILDPPHPPPPVMEN